METKCRRDSTLWHATFIFPKAITMTGKRQGENSRRHSHSSLRVAYLLEIVCVCVLCVWVCMFMCMHVIALWSNISMHLCPCTMCKFDFSLNVEILRIRHVSHSWHIFSQWELHWHAFEVASTCLYCLPFRQNSLKTSDPLAPWQYFLASCRLLFVVFIWRWHKTLHA